MLFYKAMGKCYFCTVVTSSLSFRKNIMGDFSLDLRAVLTIISIITAIALALIFQWWRNRKSLSYEIVSNTLLLTTKEEIKEKIQILYDGTPVNNVRLFTLKLINNGKQAIDEKDFKKNVEFIFSDSAKILSAEIITVSPENLRVKADFTENKLLIIPLLLNSKDFMKIKVIVSTDEDGVSCDARILGIKAVKQTFGEKYEFFLNFTIGYMGVTLVALLLALSGFLGKELSNASLISIAFSVLIVFPLALKFYVFRRSKSNE